MKIPLAYRKIPDTTDCPLKQCKGYVKYDGTNIHWYWHRKNGWEFGTRRNRYPLTHSGIEEFNQNHPGLSEIFELFESFRFITEYLIHEYKAKEFTLFTEFYGDHSFAGLHQENDPKHLVLIDNLVYDGEKYYSSFEIEDNLRQFEDGNFKVAEIFYRGKYSGQLVEDIRKGKYPLNEGAVLKGEVKNYGLYMAKVKTNAYMERLKENFKDSWKDYWE